jgi:hypothetical protein
MSLVKMWVPMIVQMEGKGNNTFFLPKQNKGNFGWIGT